MKVKVLSNLILIVMCLVFSFPSMAGYKKQEYDYLLDSTMEQFKTAGNTVPKIPINDFIGTEEEADNFGTYIYKVYDYTSDLKVYKQTNDGTNYRLYLESENPEKTYVKQNQVVFLFQAKAKEIEHLTDLEKVTAIHDWLAEVIVYDDTYAKNNVYSAVIQRSSACNGYGRSFQAMCDVAGIECESIIGTANNQRHIWNRVKLSGEWKYVDLTWNNQGDTKTWFLVSKAFMDNDHKEDI